MVFKIFIREDKVIFMKKTKQEKNDPNPKPKPKSKKSGIQRLSDEKYFLNEKIKSDETKIIETYLKSDGKPLKIFAGLFKGHYGKLFLSAVFFIMKNSSNWIGPLIFANFINIIVARPENAFELCMINAVIGLLIRVLNVPFHVLHIKYFSIAQRNVEAGLRGAMIRKLQQLSISFHKEMESGRIQSKVMRDVEAVEGMANQIITSVFEFFLTIIITSAVLISKNVKIFLLFLVAIPITVIVVLPFKEKMKKRNHNFRKEIEGASSDVMDMVELVSVTRAHALENREINKLTRRLTNMAQKGHELDLITSLFGSITWATMSTVQFLCLIFCIYMAYQNKITVGDITIYTNYFSQLLNGVSIIIALIPILTKGLESVNSIGEILKSCDIEEYNGKQRVTKLDGKFEFKNVFFHYNDDERLVLNNLSFTVNPGETIALVGESGSGKSTIVNMAIGFFVPNAGEIYIDGKNMKDLDMRSLRRHIAVVPQNTVLFNGTIKENITYGKQNITKAELDKVIEAANLKSVIEKLPKGINTDIGEHGGKLSGGQRQRISIARAIIRNPEVIIFDEATSALDTVSEAEIQQAINNLTKNRTTFIVAHRLSTIRTADKIAVMENGTCVEFGTYDELIAKKGAFYKYKIIQS